MKTLLKHNTFQVLTIYNGSCKTFQRSHQESGKQISLRMTDAIKDVQS